MLTLQTVENINVSLVKSFTFKVIHSERLLMETKKRRGSKIDPWGIPALILANSDDLFDIFQWKILTLWFKRLSGKSINSSLYSKPLCQTLSKGIELSKNSILVSRVELQSSKEKV